ncbi:unnamed protein product [Bemisia tabaci]|uniref:Uncharacterized protein n=1 Tax=Bemisia tabaci TaxID=7038 RepID=A0A9P0F4U9_BEMTA|nr:unnamed protein product [Bemisia tabaci]
MARCLEIAARANRLVLSTKTMRLLNACFAPVGMRGWGLPAFCAFLTPESKDKLVSYTLLMASTSELIQKENRGLSDEIGKLCLNTLAQKPKITSTISVLSAPWDVSMSGVPNPESTVMSKTKRGMMSKAESAVFKDALLKRNTETFQRELRALFLHIEIDISMAALTYKTTPDSSLTELTDRVDKNELVSQLFPFRVREMLTKTIKREGTASISFLLTLPLVDTSGEPKLTRHNAIRKAMMCRERFYAANDVHFTNHTIPDYTMGLARTSTQEYASLTVNFGDIIAACPEEMFNG